jgi:hypothetical protein
MARERASRGAWMGRRTRERAMGRIGERAIGGAALLIALSPVRALAIRRLQFSRYASGNPGLLLLRVPAKLF